MGSGPRGEWLIGPPEEADLLPVLAWAIYYTDRSCVTSLEGAWEGAPSTEVQQVVLFHDKGRRTLVGGVDEYRLPGHKHTKLGEWTTDENIEHIHQLALDLRSL